jgi:hypothetical protein
MPNGVVLVLDGGERKEFAAFLLLFSSNFVQQNLTRMMSDMMSTEVEIQGKIGRKRNLIVIVKKGFSTFGDPFYS